MKAKADDVMHDGKKKIKIDHETSIDVNPGLFKQLLDPKIVTRMIKKKKSLRMVTQNILAFLKSQNKQGEQKRR